MPITKYSKEELSEKYTRAKNAISRVREKSEKVTADVVDTMLSGATGYGMGYLKMSEFSRIPNTDIDTGLAISTVAILMGVSGVAGKQSSHALCVGQAGLAAYAAFKGAEQAAK